MHSPDEVWHLPLTQVSEPSEQSCVVVQTMSAQPLVCDHTGPDVTGAPHLWYAGHARLGLHAVGSQEPAALHVKPAPQLVAVQGGPHIEPIPVALQASNTA